MTVSLEVSVLIFNQSYQFSVVRREGRVAFSLCTQPFFIRIFAFANPYDGFWERDESAHSPADFLAIHGS